MKLVTRLTPLSIVICLAFNSFGQNNQPGELSIAFTGDAIITRKLSVYTEPQFMEMVNLLRGSTLAFTNLEMLFHNYESYPMHQSGGTYMRGDPSLAQELVWAGFDMVSMANNHTGDYGVPAMQKTIEHAEDAGLLIAGAGNSLALAREAKFIETEHGRVALISCSSTFPDHSRAGKTRGDIPPRPGLSPLRYTTTYKVTRQQMTELENLGKSLGVLSQDRQSTNRLRLFRQNFEVADEPDIITEPNQEDLEEIAAVVKNASGLADVTIVTIHAHERDGALSIPAQFVVTFARAMIDAGADIMVGHGPHVLRGVEMYKGKPILYSLSNFMFQNETLLRLPYENYERYGLEANNHVSDFNARRYRNDSSGFPARRNVWESIIAKPVWQGGELKSLTFHPIDLGFGKPRQVRGRPMMADPRLGRKIIQELADLSKPFGTTIEWKDGVGAVRLK